MYKRGLLKTIKLDVDGDSDDFWRTIEMSFPILAAQRWKLLRVVGLNNARRLEDAPEERWTVSKVKV